MTIFFSSHTVECLDKNSKTMLIGFWKKVTEILLSMETWLFVSTDMKLLKISHSLCFERMDNKYHSGHSKMLGQSSDDWWAYWHSSAGQSTKREAVLKGGLLLVRWYSSRIYDNHMAPVLINPVQWQNSVQYNSCELKNTNSLLQTTWLHTVEPWVALIWEKTGCQENVSSQLHYFWDLNSQIIIWMLA